MSAVLGANWGPFASLQHGLVFTEIFLEKELEDRRRERLIILVTSFLLAQNIELCGVGNSHHRHNARLHWVAYN